MYSNKPVPTLSGDDVETDSNYRAGGADAPVPHMNPSDSRSDRAHAAKSGARSPEVMNLRKSAEFAARFDCRGRVPFG